ncbi:MAG: glycosyltransferase [Alphaproteobacteria bacterium]
MKLLQVMAGARYGGAEEFFVRLALAFERANVDQRVAVRGHPFRKKQLSSGGVRTDTFAFRRWLDVRTNFGLRNIIRDWRPDIVLSWMSRASRACPKPKLSREFVHVGRLGGYYKLKYFRDCDHLIGNTPGMVDYVCGLGWPTEYAHYLPNFVSERRAPPLDRKILNTPGDAPLLLGLGRLHENKAFDVLLDSMALLPDHWLWLAGTGPQEAALRSQAVRLGIEKRVRFLGWRDDVAPLFSAANILVCPSRSEPLGNVVLEAWAQHVPVIAAASEGLQQLIDHEVNGLLVPTGDAPALAKSVMGITVARAEALAASGWASYRESYNEGTVVSRYLDFFNTVAR